MRISKKKMWLWATIIVVVAIILITVFSFGNGKYETISAEKKDLVKVVEISGKVVPAEEVNLSFVASGKVIEILKDVGDQVKVGDVIARIDSSDVRNEILEAQANLQSEQAQLSKISGDTNSSQVNLARDSLIQTLNKAYVNADSIVRNTVDTFFEDADTINAEFILSLGLGKKVVNDGREVAEKVLDDWVIRNSAITTQNLSNDDISYVLSQIKKIDSFVATISSYSSDFAPEGSVTQTQIDSYVTSLATARTTLSSLNIEINTSLDNLSGLESDIPIQNAKIINSQATVSKLQAKASDYVLVAPFNGLITENNLELGKFSGSSDIAFILISDSPLEIETFIPEINIVGVDVGDKVVLRFDALGEDVFVDAVVTHIDPRATVNQGVVTYRTLIDLIEPNNDLRPGMSANIEIIKEIVSGQIVVPNYVVQEENNKKYVEKKVGEKIEKVEISISDKDNRGSVSVKGNISPGDTLIIPKD